MTEKTPDDIFALCSKLNIDGDRYRVFPKKEPRRTSSPAAPVVATELPEVARQTNRTMLRNLSLHVNASSALQHPLSNPLAESIVIYSAAGGVGATTVAATLARFYSRRCKRTALLDARKDSLLPILFGGRTSEYANGFYFGSNATEQALATVFTPDSWLSRRFGPFESPEDWLPHCLSFIEEQADHLLIDAWPSFDFASLGNRVSGIDLLVAVPDLSSMMGARSFLTRRNDSTPQRTCLCVLNKFDRSLALHNELLAWFEQMFDGVICLDRSDLPDESLAEGMTVVDWAPSSVLSEQYRLLAKRIEAAWSSRPLSSSRSVHEEELQCR